MRRADRLVIRLSGTEKSAIVRLARVERLPASTLVRRLILKEVERRGLWQSTRSTTKGQAQAAADR